MRLTNNHGLPEAIYNAILRDDYSKGNADFSCTGLIKPPLMARLERDHHHEIEEDAVDRIWALCGQLIHALIERGAPQESIPEARLFMRQGNFVVSGKPDIYFPDAKRVQDYKFTSIYAVSNGVKSEWKAQLNILSEIIRQNGGDVRHAEIVAILRDWSQGRARRDETYLQSQYKVIPVELWSRVEAQRYIADRCELHALALNAPSPEDVPPCTDEETWSKPPVWAVMKKGKNRAVKLHADEGEAVKHAEGLNETKDAEKPSKDHSVEYRPGERTRCEFYCNVAPWCWAHRAAKEEMACQMENGKTLTREKSYGSK